MTICEVCRRAEMTPMQRLMEDILLVIGIERRDRMWNRLAVPAFILAGRTMYDQHRAAYERTGDPAELKRMLRHVTPID